MKKHFIVFFLLSTIYYLLYTPVQAQQSLPTLEITFPPDGYVFESVEDLEISFDSKGFLFIDFKNNREPFPGNSNAGHAHLWVVSTDFKGELNHDSAEKILQSFHPEKFTVEGPGKYRAIVELTQNHHLAYDPPVRQEVVFTVGSPALRSEIREAIFSGGSVYSKAAIGLMGLLVALGILKAVVHLKKGRSKKYAENAVPTSEAGGNNTAQHSIPRK